MNRPGAGLSSSAEEKSVRGREKTRIGSTHVWMTGFPGLLSYGFASPSQDKEDSALLLADSLMDQSPAASFMYLFLY